MEFTTVLDWFAIWSPRILTFIGAFSVLATMTPNKSDDKIVQFLADLVNFFGGNLGKAKNGDV